VGRMREQRYRFCPCGTHKDIGESSGLCTL
jgi:hypothetical protein